MVNQVCPFCHDEGYDLMGLAYHVHRYCDGFKDALEAAFHNGFDATIIDHQPKEPQND